MLKRQGRTGDDVTGRFDWMRQNLLAVVGGNFYFETPVPVQLGDVPVIWFTRDEGSHLLLNLRMPTTSGEPRMQIEENFWISRGTPDDIECPPHGRIVVARYANGDLLGVEFVPDLDLEGLKDRYPDGRFEAWGLTDLPVTAVEIRLTVAGGGIDFDSRRTQLGGIEMVNCFSSHNAVGVQLG